jgi:hypothetical protein
MTGTNPQQVTADSIHAALSSHLQALINLAADPAHPDRNHNLSFLGSRYPAPIPHLRAIAALLQAYIQLPADEKPLGEFHGCGSAEKPCPHERARNILTENAEVMLGCVQSAIATLDWAYGSALPDVPAWDALDVSELAPDLTSDEGCDESISCSDVDMEDADADSMHVKAESEVEDSNVPLASNAGAFMQNSNFAIMGADPVLSAVPGSSQMVGITSACISAVSSPPGSTVTSPTLPRAPQNSIISAPSVPSTPGGFTSSGSTSSDDAELDAALAHVFPKLQAQYSALKSTGTPSSIEEAPTDPKMQRMLGEFDEALSGIESSKDKNVPQQLREVRARTAEAMMQGLFVLLEPVLAEFWGKRGDWGYRSVVNGMVEGSGV